MSKTDKTLLCSTVRCVVIVQERDRLREEKKEEKILNRQRKMVSENFYLFHFGQNELRIMC